MEVDELSQLNEEHPDSAQVAQSKREFFGQF